MAIVKHKYGEWKTCECTIPCECVRDHTMSGNYVKYDPPLVTHEYVGQVTRVFHRDYRAMSDVYTSALYAEVVTPAGIKEIFVNANFECDASGDYATVDATEATLVLKKCFEIEAEKRAEERAKRERAEREEAYRLRELNAPKVGKKMIVFKGRKVPQGTVGVVAYIHSNGGILLKNETEWKNRKANGVWVNADNLQAADQAQQTNVRA